MLITAGVAIGAAVTGTGATSIPGVTKTGATALLGTVGLILVLWLVIFDFPEGVDRGIGILLAIPATARSPTAATGRAAASPPERLAAARRVSCRAAVGFDSETELQQGEREGAWTGASPRAGTRRAARWAAT